MGIYIAFGLSGAGKSYFAKWAGRSFHVHVEDADDWLTDEMRSYIKSRKIFTPEMLDTYFNIVIDKIRELKKLHPNIIISQALYLEKNRQQLLAAEPEIQFILVTAKASVIEDRLIQRGNEVTLQYAKDNASYFETPIKHSYFSINNSLNNSDISLMHQCRMQGIFSEIKPKNLISRLFTSPIFNNLRRSFQRHSIAP